MYDAVSSPIAESASVDCHLTISSFNTLTGLSQCCERRTSTSSAPPIWGVPSRSGFSSIWKRTEKDNIAQAVIFPPLKELIDPSLVTAEEEGKGEDEWGMIGTRPCYCR